MITECRSEVKYSCAVQEMIKYYLGGGLSPSLRCFVGWYD